MPLGVVVPLSIFLRYGPLVARRIPRFAASEYAKEPRSLGAAVRAGLILDSMGWLGLYTLVRDKQYDKAWEADVDLQTIWRARNRLTFPNESALYSLFRKREAKTPASSVSPGATMGACWL